MPARPAKTPAKPTAAAKKTSGKLVTLKVVLPAYAEEALMKATKTKTPQEAVERAVLMMSATKQAKPTRPPAENPPERPKHPAITVNDIPTFKDIIPGYGGNLSFTTDGVFIFIPKSFMDSWPAIAVDADPNGAKIIIRRADKKASKP